jgi:hypothetical protein
VVIEIPAFCDETPIKKKVTINKIPSIKDKTNQLFSYTIGRLTQLEEILKPRIKATK